MRIALVGTRGVPARYGGFETCAEEIGWRLVERGHQVVVYCRKPAERDTPLPSEYRGMDLIYLRALRRRSLETLSHTGLSAVHLARHRTDVAIVFNAANALWLPVLRAARIPVATHVDGLEWQRGKWGRVGKAYYRRAERLSVRWSDALIADAVGIQDYYRDRYWVGSELISYGAPRIRSSAPERLVEVGAQPGGYYLVVARFEPENHVDMIVEGYRRSGAKRPLMVVGSAPYSEEFTRRIHDLADNRVVFLGGVWDQELLDELYANAYLYLHGHSVGGTNPSLLRAAGAGAPVAAFDVVFNREVMRGAGRYFSTAEELTRLIDRVESTPDEIKEMAQQSGERAATYDWDDVADRYQALCLRLARSKTGARTGSPSAVDHVEPGASVVGGAR